MSQFEVKLGHSTTPAYHFLAGCGLLTIASKSESVRPRQGRWRALSARLSEKLTAALAIGPHGKPSKPLLPGRGADAISCQIFLG
jgi:hypothetical protein